MHHFAWRWETVTRYLVLANLVVLGLMGSMVDRMIVATRAWDEIGVLDWANYSLHADYGNGLWLYPVQGILPTVLALGAAVSHRFHRGEHRAGVPIYLTAMSMIGVMAVTLVAAPTMLGVDDLGQNIPALQHAFERFTLWGVYVRGTFFALAFLAAAWASITIVRHRPTVTASR